MVDVLDLLVLSRVPEIGPGRLLALVTEFGEPRRVLGAAARELATRGRLPRHLAAAVARFSRTAAGGEARRFADRQLSAANRNGSTIVSFWDPRYPDLLRRIADPPPLLFVQGTLSAAGHAAVAVVGTRQPSSYGIAAARHFAAELARRGITVTSGLARGIDTAAHAAALEEGGRTDAVIGSGLDVVYPPENLPLVRRIVRRGAVISECPMGAAAAAQNFPRRNRLISGLTLGTIVIESGPRGGAMITARSALDQNREVFAVPASVSPGERHGTNLLIQEGSAKLIETIDDVLDELPADLRPQRPNMPPELSLFDRAVYDALTESPDQLARIARRAKMPAAAALASLERLVTLRLVRKLSPNSFTRRQ